ncbi:hypothetical protein [Bathymodiolus thermophilus thioautotrophic gill symbiont]|jgi:hypothetical protein|uniref:Uncharacterized protein n=1 Tax=Bathymodiolus thermophilus thioautotrophic gill symbiont TaxID=2360 RepID=A0A1J5UHY4_9GAMM|nr:hypothetical protein [Bathymodiolus thermophilus thioautotrophic gill symbiont]OIR23887.1 hypothetical protein BGC33_08480 [Bathymodiolus thermophilus thioautotrophic gill symbiont]CAB5496965.1 hypothetical protein THERMOS_598 [Bathymodiolus thermophilus thioautotrophic gill symbiont]
MKNFFIFGLLVMSISSHSYADSKFVQVADCPNAPSYACCMNPEWKDVLWLSTEDKIISAHESEEACLKVGANFNAAFYNNCIASTEIFNHPHSERIPSECTIKQYPPYPNAKSL